MSPERTPHYLAERVGFEPTRRYNRLLELQSSAFDHSATSPAVSDSRGFGPTWPCGRARGAGQPIDVCHRDRRILIVL